MSQNTDQEIEDIIRKAFEIYNTDKSGIFNGGETLKGVIDTDDGQEELTDEQIAEIIDAVDSDCDGKFTFEELREIIAPILKQNKE